MRRGSAFTCSPAGGSRLHSTSRSVDEPEAACAACAVTASFSQAARGPPPLKLGCLRACCRVGTPRELLPCRTPSTLQTLHGPHLAWFDVPCTLSYCELKQEAGRADVT